MYTDRNTPRPTMVTLFGAAGGIQSARPAGMVQSAPLMVAEIAPRDAHSSWPHSERRSLQQYPLEKPTADVRTSARLAGWRDINIS
jgi:hypothetical protein